MALQRGIIVRDDDERATMPEPAPEPPPAVSVVTSFPVPVSGMYMTTGPMAYEMFVRPGALIHELSGFFATTDDDDA